MLASWTDRSRNREIPYKLYLPQGSAGPAPVILFSHGLGGSREGAAYLNRFLATHGYVVVALQHPGSDAGLIDESRLGSGGAREALMRGATAQTARDRFQDVRFAIDSLKEMNRASPLAGRMDLQRIGMSGHSFGSVTTLVVAGQRVGPRGEVSFRDPRIRAAAAYSPNKPALGDPVAMLRDVRVPMLHMTGTNDNSVLDRGVTFSDRMIPFQAITGAPQHLVVLTEGDHQVFSGRRQTMGREHPRDAAHTRIIKAASLAFWNGYLKGDAAAAEWLGNLGSVVGGEARVEVRGR